MTFVDKTVPGQTKRIAFEIDLPHPPQKVWRALITPELLAQWLLPVSGFELKKGVNFTFQTQPFPGWDGTVHCRMLDIDPLKRISYAWVVGDMELDTVVTFELTQTATGSRLLLVQTGFTPQQKQNFGGARYGWKMMSEKLATLLASNHQIEE